MSNENKLPKEAMAEANDREEAYQIAFEYFGELEEQYRKAHQRFIEFRYENHWLKNRIERIQGIQSSDDSDTIEFDEISTMTLEGRRGSGKAARAYLSTELAEDLEGGDDDE